MLESTRISGGNPVLKDSELVLGLVAPVGTNFERFQNLLARCIAEIGYTSSVVRLSEITEYGRATHAEMEALLSCARSGVSTRGCTLFSTTFPCHNCAKHIIAAGVKRVVFVEPYPKSQATDLFKDSIYLGAPESAAGCVAFQPFVGIGPRRFFDLFSMELSSGTNIKRKKDGRRVEWAPMTGVLRVPLLPNSYLERERLAANELDATTEPGEGST